MIILITRPNHDKATNYLYFWSQPVLNLAKNKNIGCIDLAAEKATSALLRQYNKKLVPSFFFLNGHGASDVIFGHDNCSLLRADENLEEFHGRLFYCRSCDAASILGSKLVRSGARGFIGYKRKFSVGYMPEYMTHPLDDPLAKKFLEPSNTIPTSILKGHSIGDAYRRSQSAMRKNFRQMMTSTASLEERYYAQFLWANIKNQVVLGDPSSAI